MELRIRHIPEELHLELKLIAVKERKSINAKIIELIEKEVARKNKGKR